MTTSIDTSLLKKESPNLYGKILRMYGSVPEPCKIAYDFAREHGGNSEIWFTREEGVSFNPRAARVGVILIEGVGSSEAVAIETLYLGILSSILIYPDSLKRMEDTIDSKEISFEKFRDMHSEYTQLAGHPPDIKPEHAKIFISLFIDKMRHIHLCESDKTKLIGETYGEAKYYHDLSEKHFHYYKPFIAHWMKRYSNHESHGINSK